MKGWAAWWLGSGLPLAIQARRLMPLPKWQLLSRVAWAALMTSYCTLSRAWGSPVKSIGIRQQQSNLYQCIAPPQLTCDLPCLTA